MLDDSNFFVVQARSVTKFGLKGIDLMLFSIIYQYSQATGEPQEFTASLSYLCEWSGVTKPTVIESLKRLVDKQLIIKSEKIVNNIKVGCYRFDKEGSKQYLELTSGEGSKESLQGSKNSLQGSKKILQGSKEILLPPEEPDNGSFLNESENFYGGSKKILQGSKEILLPPKTTDDGSFLNDTYDSYEDSAKNNANNYYNNINNLNNNINNNYNNINKYTTRAHARACNNKLISSPKSKKSDFVDERCKLLAEFEFREDVEEMLVSFLENIRDSKGFITEASFRMQLQRLATEVSVDKQREVVETTVRRGWKALDYMIDSVNQTSKPSFDTSSGNFQPKDPNNDRRAEQYIGKRMF